MNRLTALALVAAFWAAVYLPGLGSTEIKGEEGRRILPAIAMLETGHWLVPHIGGQPYLRKPPLVNWAIALSFKVTGIRNEWTARLPSALCVLVLGLVIAGVSGRGWLDVETSFIAALMAMTQFGLLAKAKFAGAEIEGIYAPLTGMAIVCWLAWQAQRRSPWLAWCVPGALLGLACLAKGPSLHLLYYYAIVLAVLWREKEMRQLAHPAHLAGLALCAAVFAAWAVPYFQSPEAATAAEVWKRQGLDRFTESDFNLTNYLTNIPRALGDLLPWVLLAPLAWRLRDTGVPPVRSGGLPAPHRRDASVALWAVAVCFVAVLLVPGTLPRYVLPLGAPIALLLACVAVQTMRQDWQRWLRFNQVLAAILFLTAITVGVAVSRFALPAPADFPAGKLARYSGEQLVALTLVIVAAATAGAAALDGVHRVRPIDLTVRTAMLIVSGCLLHAALALTWLRTCDDIRPVAAEIDATIPAGTPLVIHDPGYLPAIFYLRAPYRYAPRTEDIPADAAWVLARGGEREKLAEQRPDLRVVRTIGGEGKRELLLLQGADRTQKVPAP
jgi:4-amino-4-deoxy-L-arabinose transferase-like glycosyltransferase